MKIPKNKVGLRIITLLTGLVGILNLLSAVTPGLPARVKILQEIYPFEVRAGSHIFAAMSGFILLTLALRLWRRKRVAWLLTTGLVIISILSNLLKGLDIEETIPAIILLVLLLVFRQQFTALSGLKQNRESPRLAGGLDYLYQHLNRFYKFQGLHGFKDKFNPRWESRYLIYPNLAALPDVVVALVRADSGDRLWDYWKPGA